MPYEIPPPAGVAFELKATPARGSFGNLIEALAPYGVGPDQISMACNVFMKPPVDGAPGALTIEPPLSKAGDSAVFGACMD